MFANDGTPSRQCNVQLPADLIDDLKHAAQRLTGHQRRGFSDMSAVCARYELEAYRRGELIVERRAKAVTYYLVMGEAKPTGEEQ